MHFQKDLFAVSFPSVDVAFMRQGIFGKHEEDKYGFHCLSGTSPGLWISECSWKVGGLEFPPPIAGLLSVYSSTLAFKTWVVFSDPQMQ